MTRFEDRARNLFQSVISRVSGKYLSFFFFFHNGEQHV
jgi:hypothetical protein